ncbi:MAG: BolA family transcriptional regulator [Acidobacteriota bacterium]|nr:MAG: BolA family transcriptional regulator [Acidobacteriota bacterium]
MIAPEQIRQRIERAFPGSSVSVRDLTGGQDHYQVEIVSEAFAGLPAVQRHRIVYAIFEDVLGGALHALSLRTLAPDES